MVTLRLELKRTIMPIDNTTKFVDIENHWAKQNIQELSKRQIIHLGNEGLFYPDQKITTEQFISWIVNSYYKTGMNESISNQLSYAIEKGLFEDYDLVNSKKWIERRQVARIVHDTLRIEMNEKDEDDWTAAKELNDLYSCRTCVQHISQVYIKGIVDPEKPNVFNPTGELTRAEAATVILKMIDRSKRSPRLDNGKNSPIELSPAQARELLSDYKTAVLLDVRSRALYDEGHLSNSLSFPLESIHNNPNQLNQKKDVPIVLYCQKGYKSRLAAELLIEAGFENVYTIPGLSDFGYELI